MFIGALLCLRLVGVLALQLKLHARADQLARALARIGQAGSDSLGLLLEVDQRVGFGWLEVLRLVDFQEI